MSFVSSFFLNLNVGGFMRSHGKQWQVKRLIVGVVLEVRDIQNSLWLLPLNRKNCGTNDVLQCINNFKLMVF